MTSPPYMTLAVEGMMMPMQARKRRQEETLLASALQGGKERYRCGIQFARLLI